jgi:murein L,D-transpeptidase YafK
MRANALVVVAVGLLTLGTSSYQQVTESARMSETRDQTAVPTQDRMPHADALQLPMDKPSIIVRKGARKLELYSDHVLLRTFKVGLGFNPTADKKQEGDGRTPEGEFYIFTKNNKSAYYLSLGISYPNREDAERGLRDSLITKGEYDAILEAMNKKTMPPQYTRLGGLIYIHGHGARSDWTLGCVALENEDIKELYEAVLVGTPVTIVK